MPLVLARKKHGLKLSVWGMEQLGNDNDEACGYQQNKTIPFPYPNMPTKLTHRGHFISCLQVTSYGLLTTDKKWRTLYCTKSKKHLQIRDLIIQMKIKQTRRAKQSSSGWKEYFQQEIICHHSKQIHIDTLKQTRNQFCPQDRGGEGGRKWRQVSTEKRKNF